MTDIDTDRGQGTASTRYCKVSVITSPAGIVTDLHTEDSNAGTGLYGAVGAFGSMCGQRLGLWVVALGAMVLVLGFVIAFRML